MNLLVIILCLLAPSLAFAADSPASGITAIADVTVTSTATLVKTSNAARIWLTCTNNDTSVAVRWGDGGVTSSTGQKLAAGGTIEVSNRAAIFMASESTDVVISCTEETR